MKRIALMFMAVAILLTAGCKGGKKAQSAQEQESEQAQESYMTAIERFLTDSIASHYLQGAYCVPFCNWISADTSNPDSIAVLGDFWVMNYVQEADTLKSVSGGNHSGRMLVCKDADGHWVVKEFEQTADGSDNVPSAQRIFGDKFDAFAAAHSNDIEREKKRESALGEFVKATGLQVHFYKDYGWPALEIPRK